MPVACRPQEGLFGLREWMEEGFYPEGWEGPPDGLGLAPFKRRGTPNAATKAGKQVGRDAGAELERSRLQPPARLWTSQQPTVRLLHADNDCGCSLCA